MTLSSFHSWYQSLFILLDLISVALVLWFLLFFSLYIRRDICDKCTRLAILLQCVATCCESLEIELVRMPSATLLDEPGQITTASCNIHKCCMKNVTIFKLEPTTPNMSQQGGQTHANVAPNNVAIIVGLKCCDCLARTFLGLTCFISLYVCFS